MESMGEQRKPIYYKITQVVQETPRATPWETVTTRCMVSKELGYFAQGGADIV